MGLFDFFKQKKAVPVTKAVSASAVVSVKYSATEIVEELEKAGYFKYDDADDLSQLRSEIGQSLADEGFLTYVEMGRRNADLRHFGLDNEDLYEEGGIVNALGFMSLFFERAGIAMVVTDHLEEYDNKQQWVDQTITLNNKKYELFHHFKGYGWGEAAQRFADMINDQLSLQQSDERLFLINGDNDGRAVFLTGELFFLLRKYISDPKEQPMPTSEWCAFCKVDYFKVD